MRDCLGPRVMAQKQKCNINLEKIKSNRPDDYFILGIFFF